MFMVYCHDSRVTPSSSPAPPRFFNQPYEWRHCDIIVLFEVWQNNPNNSYIIIMHRESMTSLARWLFAVTLLCIFAYRIAMKYNKTDKDCRYRSLLEINVKKLPF